MAYLSKSDWQRHLKSKELSSVKKTGMSDLLGDYEKAVKKGDKGAQVVALEKISDKTDEVKGKWPKLKTLTDYLDGIKKAAKVESDKIGNQLEKAAEDDELEGADSSLAESLTKLRKADQTSQQQFVLAPGKPSTGLVVRRKSLSQSHVKKAHEMRGKSGVYFTGTCFYEQGKFIFVFPQQPARGLALSIKLAARLHAGMNINVQVRGGGITLDDTQDTELDEAGEGKSASGGMAKYADASKFDGAIDRVAQMPEDRRLDAMSGLLGRIRLLKQQASSDVDLKPEERDAVVRELDLALDKARRVMNVGGQQQQQQLAATSKYPTPQDWSEWLEKCLRVDPDKRRPAIEVLRKRMADTEAAVKQDQGLSEQDRQVELQTIAEARRMVVERAREYVAAVGGARALDFGRRLRDLETEFDIARKQTAMPREVLSDIAGAILAARKTLAGGDAQASAAALDELERKLRTALAITYRKNEGEDRAQKQTAIHDTVKHGIEVFKKGSFASGTADALFRETADLKLTSGLKQLGDRFRQCEGAPTPDNLAALSREGQAFLDTISRAKGKLDPVKDADKIKALDAQAKIARKAVQRVRLLELANQMEAIGAPPWNDDQQSRMAELQVAFFFEEGAIKQDVAEFGAPQRGDDEDESANDVWWIKRVDANWGQIDPNDPDKQRKIDAATKTYIFKAQDLEATKFPGIPNNGGVAREALASNLSDMMVGSGFDVGVCPTHLVAIDSAKLGGLKDQSAPRTFGAVQLLADNKGPIATSLKADAAKLRDSVSHKNISDIAVFDLMFLNLDRHGKNLLVQEQPDGSNKLVPIDHGIGLPDADGQRLHRFRVAGEQNILMVDELRSRELLDAETRANLKKMDARAMAAELKRKQLEVEARHPETKGMVDPAEFDRMARRIEFMQAAADIMTSRQLTKAIASYSPQINAANTADLPQLARQLKVKLDAVEKGEQEVATILPMKASFPYAELQDLGWCVGMARERLGMWISENADFVGRVLKAKIRNPKAVEEVGELARRINDPALEKKLNTMPIGQQLEELREAVGSIERKRKSEALKQVPAEKNERVKLLEQLGGKQALAELSAAFPRVPLSDPAQAIMALRRWRRYQELGGEAAVKEMRRWFPGIEVGDLTDLLESLETWHEFESLGGMRTYIDVGGMGDTLAGSLDNLRALKSLRDSDQVNKTLQIDPARIDVEQRKIVDQSLRALRDLTGKILIPDKNAEQQRKVQEIEGLLRTGDVTGAQGLVERQVEVAAKQAKKEADEEKQMRGELSALNKAIVSLRESKPTVDLRPFVNAARDLDGPIGRHEFPVARKAIDRLDLDIDRVANGEASKSAKMEKEILEIGAAVARLQTEPGAAKAQLFWNQATQAHANLDLSTYNSKKSEVSKYLQAVPRMQRIERFAAEFRGEPKTKEKLEYLVRVMRGDIENLNGGAAIVTADNAMKDDWAAKLPPSVLA